MPKWFLGQDLTSIVLAVGTRSATTGLVTYSGSNSLTSSIDYISWDDIRPHDQIMPVNSGKVHNEPILIDSAFNLGEIKKKAASTAGGSVISHLTASAQYIQATCVMADGVTFIFQGSVGHVGDGVKVRGKNTVELSLLQYDDGVGGGISRTEA